MRYAKLINNYPSYAPRKIRIGDEWIFNPTDAMLMDAGYLPVIETEPPETDANHYVEPRYVERDGQIVQEWDIVELPPEPDEVSPEEIVDALMEVFS